MAIKVHGKMFTTATMRVVACLFEKDLDFELVPVDMATGDHRKEPFLSLNPFGQVPAFEDGDLKLIESRAITQYIAHRYADRGNQLLCREESNMAIMSMWMEIEAHRFHPPASKLTFELGIKPIIGRARDEAAVIEEYEWQLAKVVDVYEDRLSRSKYLAGDEFTLADLHHLPAFHYLMESKLRSELESRPHVSAWCADILARPAWSKVLEMSKSERRVNA